MEVIRKIGCVTVTHKISSVAITKSFKLKMSEKIQPQPLRLLGHMVRTVEERMSEIILEMRTAKKIECGRFRKAQDCDGAVILRKRGPSLTQAMKELKDWKSREKNHHDNSRRKG